MRTTYELYYWSEIQGRGEFVRLALENAGAQYVDVARRRGGTSAMLKRLDDEKIKTPPFAPPFLKAGKLLIGQTANILLYLGPHLDLALAAEAGRLWAHQLQLTIADLNVASILSWARLARVDLSAFPHVKQWLMAALQRPAAVKAAPKRSS